jgi:hypothetical protein
MTDWVLGLWANKWIAFGLYWLPLAFCAFGYVVRTARNFAKDRAERMRAGAYYHPTDTIGTLIGRGVVTIVPIANFCAAVFDLAPEVFGRFFKWIGRVFDQPLVPDVPNGPEIRKARATEQAARTTSS